MDPSLIGRFAQAFKIPDALATLLSGQQGCITGAAHAFELLHRHQRAWSEGRSIPTSTSTWRVWASTSPREKLARFAPNYARDENCKLTLTDRRWSAHLAHRIA
jgi:hypothetical protein